MFGNDDCESFDVFRSAGLFCHSKTVFFLFAAVLSSLCSATKNRPKGQWTDVKHTVYAC